MILVLAFPSVAFAQEVHSANLHGTVRDSQGKPVGDAVVEIRSSNSNQKNVAHTDAHGVFNIAGLREGVYDLRVTKAGYADGGMRSVFLGAKEEKTIEFVLRASGSAASVLGKPKFSDETQFTVSGVTDPSNLGGHGSDTVVRTRESLAADTVSMGKSSVDMQPAGSSAAEKSLQESATNIRSQLAQHDGAELHRQLAEIEEKLGDPLEAARQYQRAAEMDPSESNLFNWGADVLLHHAPEPAMQIFARGNALFPQSERMLLGWGATSFALGKNEEAIQRICRASDLNPSDPIPYHFLGQIELAEIRPSHDAVEKLRRFVTLQPSSPEGNYYYAVALWKENKGAVSDVGLQAETLLENALGLDPKFAAAALQLGIIHSDEGKYSEAVSNYKQAIRLDPKMEEAHFRLAQAYRRLGQTEQAQEEMRLYEQLAKESALEAERSRREVRQLVYTLRTTDH